MGSHTRGQPSPHGQQPDAETRPMPGYPQPGHQEAYERVAYARQQVARVLPPPQGSPAAGNGYHQPQAAGPRGIVLTAAESFWYVLGCIAFAGMYFAKIPAKKALSEAGLAEMTSAERFWYVLQCIAFGAGYFAKIPVKKALSEAAGLSRQAAA
jgi:hypothetical protein